MSPRRRPSSHPIATVTKESSTMNKPSRDVFLSLTAAALLLLALAIWVQPASAAVTPAPRWDAQMVAKPTNFKVGAFAQTSNQYEFLLANFGGAPWSGPVQ